MTEQIPVPEAPAGRKILPLAIIGISLVVVVALAGGAFAVYKKLDGGGKQPHDVLPASVVAYTRIDLDPSASQKIALFKLIRKFPEAADDIGIKSADQDVRKLIVKSALDEAGCDLTYDKDVEPWLGNRIGVGLDKEETPLVAIQVKNEGKAEKGIKALFECGDEKASVVFLDGYAIVAEDQKTADAAVKSAAKSSLGDKKQFIADFDSLGEQGVASAWADTSALIEGIPELEDALGGASSEDAKELKESGSAALTLRASGSTLEVAGLTGLTDSFDKMSAAPLGKLPSDTAVALSVGSLGDQIADQFDALIEGFSEGFGAFGPAGPSPTDPSVNDDITEFEQETGLKLPEDIKTLFGDGLSLTAGSANLEKLPTLSGPEDIAALDIALKMTTDPAKGLDLAKRLAALAAQSGIQLATSQTEDGAVIATNQGAADALDGSGKLGEDKTFKSVMPYGNSATYGLFVDVGTILDKLSEAGPPEDVAKDIEEAKALDAVGFSYGKKGKHALFSLRIALAK